MIKQAEKEEEEDYRIKVATGEYGPSTSHVDDAHSLKKYKKDAYFSDEEELDTWPSPRPAQSRPEVMF